MKPYTKAALAATAATAFAICAFLTACNGLSIATQGSVHLNSKSASKLSGFLIVRGGRIKFNVSRTESGAWEAMITPSKSAEPVVRATIASPRQGAVTVGDVTLDGYGTATAQEKEALARLASSELGQAIPVISLELGCILRPNDSMQAFATLVLPWQMLMKYQADYPPAEHFAGAATCKYFEPNAAQEERLLLLGPDERVPLVPGYLPLDAEGEVRS